MKIIFEIRPYRAINDFTLIIYGMVAHHNSGSISIRLSSIEQHVLMIKALKLDNVDAERNDNYLFIAQDHELVMTIIEKEIMELDEAQIDLLTQQQLS